MNRNFTAFCAAFLAFAIMMVFFGTVYNNKKAVAEEADSVRTVYLTFDDGPSDRVTPKILKILSEENVRATFFIVGRQAETRKGIVKSAFDDGHTIAVHSYSHVYKNIYSSVNALIEDIDKCNKLIKEVTGKYSYLYRFPGGSYGLPNHFVSAVTNHGLRYVDWNASTLDAEMDATPEQILENCISTSANTENVVLLAHDSTTKTATAQALKMVIEYYKGNGYVFRAF